MKPSDITAWLASPQDFAPGAALYATLGQNPTYRRLFALGPSEYAQGVLVRELRALGTAASAPERPPAAGPAPEAPLAPGPAAPPPAAPVPDAAVLADVRQQLKAARDERSHLHPQLTAKGLRKTERQALAGRIVVLTDREVELLATEAHVLSHGRLPGPVPTAEVSEAGELRRRLSNCLSRRSKLKKDPARAADLAAVEADIHLIRSKLTSPSHV